MRKTLWVICLLSLIFTPYVLAETGSRIDVGKIILSFQPPVNNEDLTQAQISIIEEKCAQLLASSGTCLAGNDFKSKNTFILCPKLTIDNTNTVEGGMQNIVVVSAELSFYIMQSDGKTLFAEYHKKVKGSGINKEAAINNIILGISPADKDLLSFIESAKLKILGYYNNAGAAIISEADYLIKTKSYDEAIGLLMMVPEGTECYSAVKEKALAVYVAGKEKISNEQIQNAKKAIIEKQYTEALQLLVSIEPDTSCFAEAQQLINKIEKEVRGDDAGRLESAQLIYNDSVELEKKRIEAIKAIAVSYYQKTH